MNGTLVLLPNLLGELRQVEKKLAPEVVEAARSVDGLIVETEKVGRAYLKFVGFEKPHVVPIALYPKKPRKDDLEFLLEPMVEKGERWGLLSDAGIPCVADPGAQLVRRARQKHVTIEAHPGPSSIFQALMVSGLPAQRFTFHGYLDKDPQNRKREIQEFEKRAHLHTHICIEAPHRNQHLLEALLSVLRPTTWLCVAWDLTLPTEGVMSQPVHKWKKGNLPDLNKKPAIFAFCVIENQPQSTQRPQRGKSHYHSGDL